MGKETPTPEVIKEVEKEECKLSKEDRMKLEEAGVNSWDLKMEAIRSESPEVIKKGFLAEEMGKYDLAHPEAYEEKMEILNKRTTDAMNKREELLKELSQKGEFTSEDIGKLLRARTEEYVSSTDLLVAKEGLDVMNKMDKFQNEHPEEYEKLLKAKAEREKEKEDAKEELTREMIEKIS